VSAVLLTVENNEVHVVSSECVRCPSPL
jgi:hypothetical protein